MIKFRSSRLERLSPDDAKVPIRSLHLTGRSVKVLEKLGIQDLGNLVTAVVTGLRTMTRPEAKTDADIFGALNALALSRQPGGSIDWLGYASRRGRRILPTRESFFSRGWTFPEAFIETLQDALALNFSPKQMFVFRANVSPNMRLGPSALARNSGHTKQLESFTRQRMLEMLRGTILRGDYINTGFYFRPSFCLPLQRLKKRLGAQGTAIPRALVARYLGEELHTDLEVVAHSAALLFEILGYRWLDAKGVKPESLLVPASPNGAAVLNRIKTKLDSLLRVRCPAGLPLHHIRQQLGGTVDGLTNEDLALFIDTIEGVEGVAGGVRRFSTNRLTRVTDRLYRLLGEQASPLSVDELAARLGQIDLATGRVRTARQVCNALSRDTRFKCIGRSGLWALRHWQVETSPIADVAARFLSDGQAMTEEQLYAKISKLRPLSLNSVGRLLNVDPRFERVSPACWRLQQAREPAP